MPLRLTLAAVLVVLVLAHLPAGAQTQPGTLPQPVPLTVEEALEMAERYNPQLRVAAAQISGAQARITTARAYPNPEFNVLAGNQRARLLSSVPGLMQHYSVSQQVDMPQVREARIAAAEIGLQSTGYVQAETRLAVRALVRQAFFQVLRRRAEVELAAENLRLVQDLRRRIQVQFDVGEAARLEVTRAEAEVASARSLQRSAELRLTTALSVLRATINAPLTAELQPQGNLAPPQALPPLDEMRTEVLSRHPALAQVRMEIRRAEAELRREQALRIPQPSLRAEYEQQPDLAFYRVGVSIPVPVWNRREGPIAEAAAALRESRAVAEFRTLEITAALERAYRQYEIAGQQVASLETGVLREAEAAVQAAEAAYRFGERGIIEVLDAQRVLRSVRNDYLNALYDRQSALIELEQLRAAGLDTTP